MTSPAPDARALLASGPSVLPVASGGFRIEADRDGVTSRLVVIGEMDLSNVGLVDVNLAALAARRPQVLILDLRRLTFMDSSGLHLVLNWAARAELDGFALWLVQGGPEIRRVFEITGTLDGLTFVDPGILEAGHPQGVHEVPAPDEALAPVGDAF